ncbi:MAG: DUF3667 domain-containing protein [Arcicella sp.]|jgi:hypothetical protein|nr:DUF3667 domain-containing protein [Arcicella sp.]
MSAHKKRRKVEICHNCHTILKPEDNFCSHCGQENHDLKVPLGHLAFEVFEGFTHFDTKFYNTMKAIFGSPGKITKDFLEGRRGRYVPPIRLYFLVSFIFFLLLDKVVDIGLSKSNSFFNGVADGLKGDVNTKTKQIDEKALTNLKNEVKKAKAEVEELKNKKDTAGLTIAQSNLEAAEASLKAYGKFEKKGKETVSSWINRESISIDEILDEMNVQNDDTLRKLIENLPEEKQRQRMLAIQKQLMADTINTEELTEVNRQMREYFTEAPDKKKLISYSLNLHSLKNNASVKINYDKDTTITVKGSNGKIENTAFLRRVLAMSDNQLDSLNEIRGNNFMGIKILNRGGLKNAAYFQLAFNEDAEKGISELSHLAVSTFSVMMFILMPIVAVLLKFIYSKRTHSIISFPFRLFRYIWDWIMYLIRFRKTRRYRHVPHLMAGHTRYYYEHLIFSIHIHSVLFLILIIFVGGGVALGYWKQAITFTMLGFFVYFIVSLKTVYRQGILKTIFKSLILFFLYFITFITVLGITGALKFAIS